MSTKFRLTATAGLGLLLASVAAPIALADVPGYEFQDFDRQSSAYDSASAAQIVAAHRKADEALATAQEAIREAQPVQQQQAQHQQPTQQVR
jgi:hypothetical protein